MSREKPLAILTDTNRSLNRIRALLLGSVVVLVLGLLWVAWAFGDATGDLQRDLAVAGAERAQIRADLLEQSAALSKANERLVDAGEKPVAPPIPAPIVGPSGEAGEQGRAPTAGEIRDAVDAYCADNSCRGPSGRSVTPAQVAGAVATYCNDRGECRGSRGSNGTDGSNGQNGAQGPPPTDAQVAQAVAAFCADGRCRGAVGPPGPAGATGSVGATGVGIATVELRQTNLPTECDLIVTFTDGTIHNAGRVTCPTDTQGQG